MTSLRQALKDYLATRRALGYQLRPEGVRLVKFVSFMEERRASYVTTALAVEWAAQSAPALAEPSRRLCMVRCFAKYMRALDERNEVPPSDLIPNGFRRIRPYLYTDEQVQGILDAAMNRSPFESPKGKYYCFFGLLFVTGMRIGEAINLTDEDVDFTKGTLLVRKAKFTKSRMIPLHPTTVKVLQAYQSRRAEYLNGRQAVRFFVSSKGTALSHAGIYEVFRAVRKAVGLERVSGRLPRIHDFRHLFAVRTMINWYRGGKEVERLLPVLSTFLGHVCVASTYWYLTEHPELMNLAVAKVNQRWEDRDGK